MKLWTQQTMNIFYKNHIHSGIVNVFVNARESGFNANLDYGVPCSAVQYSELWSKLLKVYFNPNATEIAVIFSALEDIISVTLKMGFWYHMQDRLTNKE